MKAPEYSSLVPRQPTPRQEICDLIARYAVHMYGSLLATLAATREKRGLTLAQVAKKLNKTKQHLWNWEHERGRPSMEDLGDWAGALGLRLVLELVPAEAPPVPAEILSRLAGLGAEEQREVLRYAKVLRGAEDRTRRLLLAYVNSVEVELDEAAARSASS